MRMIISKLMKKSSGKFYQIQMIITIIYCVNLIIFLTNFPYGYSFPFSVAILPPLFPRHLFRFLAGRHRHYSIAIFQHRQPAVFLSAVAALTQASLFRLQISLAIPYAFFPPLLIPTSCRYFPAGSFAFWRGSIVITLLPFFTTHNRRFFCK